MDLINSFLALDKELLLFINDLHSPFGDVVMWQVSHKFFWIPFYIFLLFLAYKRLGPGKCLLFIVLLTLAIIAADQLASSVIRPHVGRLRPSSPLNPLSDTIHLVNGYRGRSFGFPSCHAANTFALVVFLANILKSNRISAVLLIWAMLVAYSRIYLGVHYPSDILAGAFLGIVVGYNFYLLYNYMLGMKSLRFLRNYSG